MLYKNLIDQLADRLKFPDKSDVAGRLILGQRINDSYKEVARSHPWEFLKRTSEIRTVANYAAGTVNITQDSRSVTGGTGFTAAMKGRYFQPQGSNNWYRIVDVPSGSALTLEQPVIESSASGITFKIWKRYYYLLSDVQKIIAFQKWLSDFVLMDRSNQYIEDGFVDPSLINQPSMVSLYGVDPFLAKYTTGSVSMTQDSNTVTGVGTSWLGNVGAGDLFIVSNVEYRIKRVESDTSVILYQNSLSDVAAGSAYTSQPDNPVGVQFYSAADKTYIFPYTYWKRVFNMINEANDRPELPEDFDMSILDCAEYQRLKELNDPKWTVKFQEYTSRVQDLKQRLGKLSTPRYRQFSPYIPTRSGY